MYSDLNTLISVFRQAGEVTATMTNLCHVNDCLRLEIGQLRAQLEIQEESVAVLVQDKQRLGQLVSRCCLALCTPCMSNYCCLPFNSFPTLYVMVYDALDNNSNGYVSVLFIRRAHSPFI